MSSSSLRKMRSRRGRGAVGESLSAQQQSPVAPMRCRGVSIACSTRCALSTPRRFCMLGDARTPQAIPGQSPWLTKSGQATDAQLLGRPRHQRARQMMLRSKDLGSLALAVHLLQLWYPVGSAAPRCSSVTSPIGDGIFSKVVAPPPGRYDKSTVPRNTMTIDYEIERVLKNRI